MKYSRIKAHSDPQNILSGLSSAYTIFQWLTDLHTKCFEERISNIPSFSVLSKTKQKVTKHSMKIMMSFPKLEKHTHSQLMSGPS